VYLPLTEGKEGNKKTNLEMFLTNMDQVLNGKSAASTPQLLNLFVRFPPGDSSGRAESLLGYT
jgi:hypothetical protein